MLSDKVYLWMVIISCIALAVAGTLAVIENEELKDPAAATSSPVFSG